MRGFLFLFLKEEGWQSNLRAKDGKDRLLREKYDLTFQPRNLNTFNWTVVVFFNFLLKYG